MRTTARDFLMDGNEGQPFRDVIDNLDEDIILDCMEEYADYKVLNSAREEIITFGKNCFYKGFDKAKNDDANCFTAWREETNELLKLNN
jgi:hypothetical protein